VRRAAAAPASAPAPAGRLASLLAPLGIALAGLLGRSAVDKLLALRTGAAGVVAWGQMSSLLDLVVGVVAAGIGSGLAVLAAGSDAPRRAALLRSALRLGGTLSAAVAALLCAVAAGPAPWAGAIGLPRDDLALGGLAGVALSLGSLAGSYWLGAQRLRLQFLLALLGAGVGVLVAALAPGGHALQARHAAQGLPVVRWLAGAQALLALAVAAWTLRAVPRSPGAAPVTSGELLRYLPAGLALGVLGPASMLAARALTAQGLSWQAAASLQALWRVSDWVSSIAASVLSVLYLPRFGRAWGTPRWAQELRAAARAVLPASALALAVLLLLRPWVFEALYGSGFVPGAGATALFFSGSLLRVAAWIPLFALYAQGRARAIALGELASLPLFAALLAAGAARAGLAWIGAAWLLSYATYTGVNLLLLRAASPPRA
jgi:O-antigen/teichoic acid export membrane protein